MVFIPLLAVVIGLAVVVAVRRPDPASRAVVLQQVGFWLMAGVTFFIGTFIIGETFTDPGGWKAAGLVAIWAIPLAGLAALCWIRPGWAIYALTALTVAMIGVSIWFALNPEGWRAFENSHGPIRMVMTFVLVAAIGMLGLRRTAAAGILLLASGILPVAVSSLASFRGFASLAVVSVVPVISGVLYLASAHFAGGQRHPPEQTADQRRGRRLTAQSRSRHSHHIGGRLGGRMV